GEAVLRGASIAAALSPAHLAVPNFRCVFITIPDLDIEKLTSKSHANALLLNFPGH
ncbi:hypothetical protein CEXT_22831, partial [Caerostris extrusa]